MTQSSFNICDSDSNHDKEIQLYSSFFDEVVQSVKMQKWLLEPTEALDPSQISNPAPPDLNLRKRFSTVSFKEGLKISIEKFLHIKRGHHSNWVESLMSGNWHTMKKKMISKR